MRLDVADRPRREAGVGERAGDHLRLGVRIRRGVAARLAAVVDRGGADDPVDVVAVLDGARQRLEQHHADALGVDEAVRARAERAAGVAAAQHGHGRQPHHLLRVGDDVDAAGQGAVDAALGELLAGEVDRGERSGARRVDGEARTVEAELGGDAVGNRPVERALAVAAVGHAGEDADAPRRAEPGRRVTRVGDAGVALLQEQPLLRIDVQRFARRDVEKERIEALDVVDEAAPLGVDRPPAAFLRAVVPAPIPAVRRHLGDAARAVTQPLPELLQGGGSRVAARQPDDGDGETAVGAGRRRGPGRRRGRSAHRQRRRAVLVAHRRAEPPRRGVVVHRQQVIGERVDALVLEQRDPAHRAERLGQSVGDALDEDGIDAVGLEGLRRVEPLRRHAERPGDELAYVRRDPLAEPAGIRGRRDVRRAGRGRRGGRRRRRLPDDAVARRHEHLLTEPGVLPGGLADLGESLVAQQAPPRRGRQRGRAGDAQRVVGERPPSRQQAEGEMEEDAARGHLVDQRDAVRPQHRLGLAQRPAHGAGGVEDVGGDHHVVGAGLDALRRQRLLDVEPPRRQVRCHRPERLLPVEQERRRDVRVAVLGDPLRVRRQRIEDRGAGAAGAGADLDQPQADPGVAPDARLDVPDQRLDDDGVAEVGGAVLRVDARDQVERRIGEDDVGRGAPPLENVRERAEGRIEQGDARAPRAVAPCVGLVRLPLRPRGVGIGRRAVRADQPPAVLEPTLVERRQLGARRRGAAGETRGLQLDEQQPCQQLLQRLAPLPRIAIERRGERRRPRQLRQRRGRGAGDRDPVAGNEVERGDGGRVLIRRRQVGDLRDRRSEQALDRLHGGGGIDRRVSALPQPGPEGPRDRPADADVAPVAPVDDADRAGPRRAERPRVGILERAPGGVARLPPGRSKAPRDEKNSAKSRASDPNTSATRTLPSTLAARPARNDASETRSRLSSSGPATETTTPWIAPKRSMISSRAAVSAARSPASAAM